MGQSIAEFLPGRTDNEIKNYWRTRVVKQAKRLHYDVNSQQFRDVMRDIWMPRLFERIQASSEPHSGPSSRPEWVNQISMSKISSETSVDVQAPSLLNSIPCYDLSGCGTSELDIISLDDGSGYCQACDGF
ncbi:MYB transcription factor [Quillaja saponaria]|uniref:MYB transcription factor n=1 Tax=Quillaja saponaria TaxID=32244 RepID=A0AAD7QA61_QUISA|nr:MYB transcription factor [Quillaja saponaria]